MFRYLRECSPQSLLHFSTEMLNCVFLSIKNSWRLFWPLTLIFPRLARTKNLSRLAGSLCNRFAMPFAGTKLIMVWFAFRLASERTCFRCSARRASSSACLIPFLAALLIPINCLCGDSHDRSIDHSLSSSSDAVKSDVIPLRLIPAYVG